MNQLTAVSLPVFDESIPRPMKAKITFALFLLLFSSAAFSQTLNWSNEVVVASGNTYGSTRPRIAVASGNIPVVMWGGGVSTQPLYAARWNGTGFSTPATITPMGVDPFIDTWAGADMAAYGNNVYIVFKRQPETSSYMYIVHSSDGGMTWTDTMRINISNGLYSRFPSVAVTANGDPAVIYMSFDSLWGTPGYAVTNSTDGGQTFPAPVNVSNLGGSEVCDCCPGYLEIQGNRQVATWRRNNSNTRDMWGAVSNDGGMSFTFGMDLDNTDWILSSCPSTGPDPFLSGDSLFTVFMSGASGDNRIMFNSHNVVTQQDGYTAMLAPNVPSSAIQNYPFIAGSGDTMIVVWQQLNSSTGLDTYYSWSLTGSAGLFTNATMLNNTTGSQQRNPHVAYANGIFHFVFTDGSTGDVIYKSASIVPNSVQETSAANTPRVFPNPSNGTMQMELPAQMGKHVNICVNDVTGRTVESIVSDGGSRVLLGQQSPGLYLVEISDENGANTTVRVIFY